MGAAPHLPQLLHLCMWSVPGCDVLPRRSPATKLSPSNSSFFLSLCASQHFQKHNRARKTSLRHEGRDGVYKREPDPCLSFYLFIWLAVIPSLTHNFANYLIRPLRAPRPEASRQRRGRHLAAVRRHCRGGAGIPPGPCFQGIHGIPAPVRLSWPPLAGGNTALLQAPRVAASREYSAGKTSLAAAAAQGWGTKRGAGETARGGPLFPLWATTGSPKCSPNCGGFLLELKMSTVSQWQQPPPLRIGQPTHLHLSQGLRPRSATDHLHLVTKTSQFCLI